MFGSRLRKDLAATKARLVLNEFMFRAMLDLLTEKPD